MGKPVALALLVAAAIIVGVGIVRPRAAPQTRAVEHRGITAADAAEAIEAEPQDPTFRLLLIDLRHGSVLKRAQAARAMARLGKDAAPLIPDLVALLCDKEDGWNRVRYLIEDVLVAIGEEALPAALGLIAQQNKEGRRSGILLLSRLRGDAAIDTLVPLLNDAAVDGYVACRLAELGAPGRAALVAAIADEAVPLDGLAFAVADSGKPIARPLAALIDAPERATRERAAAMLEQLGRNARPVADVVFRALADTQFGDRLLLIPVLPSLRQVPPEALRSVAEILGEAAGSEWGASLCSAVYALAGLGPAARESLPALVVHMGRGGYPAAVAARAHWRISGDARVAVEQLSASIEEEPEECDGWRVRANLGTWTLIEMGPEAAAAAPTLLRALEGQDGRVRREYRDVLEAIGEAALPAFREWLPRASPEAARSLIGLFGDGADEEIFARTGFRRREPVATCGANAFENLGPEDTAMLPWLRSALREKRMVSQIVFGMRGMGESAAPAVPELIPFLEYDEVRSDTALTLAAIGPAATPAVPALERYAEDPAEEGCHAVLKALWSITRDERYADLGFNPAGVKPRDDWTVPYLIAGLARDDVRWRRDCVEALGRLGRSARPAAPDVARIAADESEDEYVRAAAREALAAMGG